MMLSRKGTSAMSGADRAVRSRAGVERRSAMGWPIGVILVVAAVILLTLL